MTREATIVVQGLTLALTAAALVFLFLNWRHGKGKLYANLLFALFLVNLLLFQVQRLSVKLLDPHGPAWDSLNSIVQAFGVNEWAVMIQLHAAATLFVAGLLYLRNGQAHGQ